MNGTRSLGTGLVILFFLLFLSSISAIKPTDPKWELLTAFAPAPTGYEHLLTVSLRCMIGEEKTFGQDNLGSLSLDIGSGKPDLAIVTPIDEPGFFVSGIRTDGYLSVDAAGPLPHHLMISMFAGHSLSIWTESGPLPAVMILPSLHTLTPETRTRWENPLEFDSALIDVGASSPEEIKGLGISMLDAVAPVTRVISLAGGKRTGWCLAQKSCIVISAQTARHIQSTDNTPAVHFSWIAQSRLSRRREGKPVSLGIEQACRRIRSQRIVMLGQIGEDRENNRFLLGKGPVVVAAGRDIEENRSAVDTMARKDKIACQWLENWDSPLLTPWLSDNRQIVVLLLPAAFSQTPAETVDEKDIANLALLLQRIMETWRTL